MYRFQTFPIQWIPGALSLRGKWLGCEVDHSSTPNAEVKECVGIYLHYPNMPSWCGGQLKKKQRDNFTFTFLKYKANVNQS
jgi:hypothetical protein